MGKAEDLSGRLFGRLTALYSGNCTNSGLTTWVCRCICGNIKTVASGDLKRGKSQSCGCAIADARKAIVEKFRKEMIGLTFGRWTVIAFDRCRRGKTYYICHCSCSKTAKVSGSNLTAGISKSCGCYAIERSEILGTCGLSHTTLYVTWRNMMARCYDCASPSFKNYGGRAKNPITVCVEWRESFISFYHWAIANGYRKGLTIERKNNDGDYCPENCTWIPKRDQSRNRRTNVVSNMEIAESIRLDTRPTKDIALDLGTSLSTILSIKSGKTWKKD